MNKPPWSTGISARGENEYIVNLSNQYSNYNADLIKGQGITILIEGLFLSDFIVFVEVLDGYVTALHGVSLLGLRVRLAPTYTHTTSVQVQLDDFDFGGHLDLPVRHVDWATIAILIDRFPVRVLAAEGDGDYRQSHFSPFSSSASALART
jgi:hypothetical protein